EVNWITPWLVEDLPLLVLADFNAQAQEAPIHLLREAGLIDLLAANVSAGQRYTYVFRGQAAYLDYAMASSALLDQIDNVALWPINADEPEYLAKEGESVWRASDHDPIVIDLR
ncbi:MAG: endonuclease, partial [Gammaproteobacteria bacterium]|nr:endonuclease [Gammaproteobacteria bacterium]